MVQDSLQPQAWGTTLIDHHVHRRHANLILCTIMLQGCTSSIEPWYKTPYSLSDISQSWQSAWTAASDDRLFLPELNPFIPSNFDLIKVSHVVTVSV